MCKYSNNGICEITNTKCEDVIICNEETVYVDDDIKTVEDPDE